jgi:5'-3' exonuclease
MQDKFKSMVTLFGMPYIVSKSEAEAECAELNRRGLVDAVMSEDVDTLLFGAETIVRGWTATASPPSSQVVILDGESADAPVSSTPASTPKSVSSPNATLDIYSASLVASHASIGLSRNALILFALLNGSDYTEGIKQLGAMTAYECVRDDPTALGPQLIKAIVEPFLLDQAKVRFTPTERAAIHATLKDHLINNPSKLLSRKKPSAASNIPSNFPPESVIRSYLRPSVYLEYPQDLLDHLANPFSVPVDWNELQTMAEEEFGWGSRKLDYKFSKTVAEAVAFWEIRKATDAALRLGASSSGEILLDQGDFVVSSSPATDSGRGQAAITDFFGQIKKRPSASGEGKSAPSSQATVSSPRGSSQEQRNPIVGIVNIKKARDTGDGANDDTEQTLPGDEGMECKARVRLLSMRSAGGATQSSSSSQGRLHPFADDIEIRIPLSMARVAAPRLVREHETSKTPKKTPKKREVPTTPPPAPKKKQKKTVVEPRDLDDSDDSDIQVLDSPSFRKGSASTSTSTRPSLIPSTRGKGLFSSTATPKSSRSMATSSTCFPKPTEDQESNPFLEDSEPKEKPTERVYKPMLWNESWEKPARFSPRK